MKGILLIFLLLLLTGISLVVGYVQYLRPHDAWAALFVPIVVLFVYTFYMIHEYIDNN